MTYNYISDIQQELSNLQFRLTQLETDKMLIINRINELKRKLVESNNPDSRILLKE